MLNLTDNGNEYQFNAIGYIAKHSLKIAVTQLKAANNYQSAGNCTAVNSNDYLNGLQIYNAGDYGLTGNYMIIATFVNTTQTIIGTASYDSYSDRVTIDGLTPIYCLSAIT